MVSQLPKVSPIKPNFDYIKDVYEPCLEKYLSCNNQSCVNWQTVRDAIQNGRKIIQSDDEVDTYIAFYGAHHYYKLVEAFDALAISKFCDQELEIISYGCGAATDTCSLISYCRSKTINLPFNTLTLIEPSRKALDRGVKYIKKALSEDELNKINIKLVNKTISDLKENDIYLKSENIKLHIFSNVLDIEEIDLYDLTKLLKNTQKGNNYFVCINPKNSQSQKRINNFYEKISTLFKIQEICTNDREINDKTIWMMKTCKYENRSIPRYHRIFRTDAAL
ncbi:hypothetical protein STA3757_31260 [Stanieria sp. NIES-3757]|nr:hypothetical protein STA3757_31260 [Stanieria sp. NIES-3757]